MAETPTSEPTTITAGDTIRWTKSLADYPASSGWVLSYALRNAAGAIDITTTAQGDDHLAAVTATVSSGYTAGLYTWYAQVVDALDTVRYTVGSGTITVLPDVAAATSYDARSHARKVLDAIEAVLESRASRDQEEITINGKSIKKTPIADLLRLRSYYLALVNGEQASSSGGTNRLLVRC